MAEQETILTEEGLKKLEDELDYLRSEKRQQVAERLKVAISYGDISENSEYDDAKNEQAFVEGRILTLEKMIRNAKVIKDPKSIKRWFPWDPRSPSKIWKRKKKRNTRLWVRRKLTPWPILPAFPTNPL